MTDGAVSFMVTAGDIGCLAMMVWGTLRKRSVAGLVVVLMLAMLICDIWVTLPMHFRQEKWPLEWLWLPALLPYGVMLRWGVMDQSKSGH